jgi:hypothetical protein
MSQCNYHRLPDGRWMCRRCLRVTKTTPAKVPKGNCSVRGLGDYLKSALDACGMTRRRWIAVKNLCGVKGKSCGCGKRQEKVNRWGDWLKSVFHYLKV